MTEINAMILTSKIKSVLLDLMKRGAIDADQTKLETTHDGKKLVITITTVCT